MTSPRDEKKNRYSEPQAKSQLLWTAIVAATLAFVAIEQAADPGSVLVSRATPEIVFTGSPLSGAEMVRPWDPQAGRIEATAPPAPLSSPLGMTSVEKRTPAPARAKPSRGSRAPSGARR